MERYENTELQVVETEEVYVTNAAIKATDVLMTIGAGVFTLAGIGFFMNERRKKKLIQEQSDFEARIISNLIREGASEEEIANAKKLLEKI